MVCTARNPCDYIDTIHLPTPEGWKAELAYFADPQRTVYPQSDHLYTIDRVRQPLTAVLITETQRTVYPQSDHLYTIDRVCQPLTAVLITETRRQRYATE